MLLLFQGHCRHFQDNIFHVLRTDRRTRGKKKGSPLHAKQGLLQPLMQYVTASSRAPQKWHETCPRCLKNAPRALPEASKIEPGASLRAKIPPRAAQERSKAAPELPKRRPRGAKRRPRVPKRRPRHAQGTPRPLQNPARGAFRRNVRTHCLESSICKALEPISCQFFAFRAACAVC